MVLLQHLACVTAMLDCLLSVRAITEQEYSAVKQQPHTLQARTLIDTVLAKGNTTATSFRNSLQEIDPGLYRDIFVQPDIRSLPTGDIAALPMEEQLRKLLEERMCKVCMDREVSIVFIPCGHLVVCKDCAPSLRKCPICRGTIKGTVRTFLSWTGLMAHGCNPSQEEQKFSITPSSIRNLKPAWTTWDTAKQTNIKMKNMGKKKNFCLSSRMNELLL